MQTNSEHLVTRIIKSEINSLCKAAKDKLSEAIVRIERIKDSTDTENLWDNYPVISNLIDEAIYEEIDSFGDVIQPRLKYKYLNKLALCRMVIIKIHDRKLSALEDSLL